MGFATYDSYFICYIGRQAALIDGEILFTIQLQVCEMLEAKIRLLWALLIDLTLG